MSRRTDLYDQHIALGANMVDFHGWMLPLHYGSQLAEHKAVREDAGMFDVSHMTVVDLLGAGCRQFLRQLLANDIDKMTHHGRAQYTCMLNHRGGIIDDLIVYSRSSDKYRLVLNAATREEDLAWLQSQSSGSSVGIQERNDFAMIAVQGPHALRYLHAVLNSAQIDAISTLGVFEFVDIDGLFIARTGYTGEDGFEIILPRDHVNAMWQELVAAGITPCGLGARDSLRLEAGLLLSGQDMNMNTTPLESGLSWTIAWEPSDREFVGRTALTIQKEQGTQYKLVGLVLDEPHIMRSGYSVSSPNDSAKGNITSGGYSPTLQCSIALARVPSSFSGTCLVEIRGKQIPAKITGPRFIKHGRSLI